MAEIYGHRWTSSYGDTPADTWCRALRNAEPWQIGQGLGSLLEREDAWPPTLPEFLKMVEPPRESKRLAPYHKEWEGLPKALTQGTRAEHREQQRECLDALRESLK